MYKDAVLASGYPVAHTRPSFTPINASIGARDYGSPSLFYKGSLDDVRIYNRALSATEIKQLYNQGK
jgi:hypothetical protein